MSSQDSSVVYAVICVTKQLTAYVHMMGVKFMYIEIRNSCKIIGRVMEPK